MELYLVLAFLLLQSVGGIIAQTEDRTVEESHYGTEFYLSFIRHYGSNKTLHIVSRTEGLLRLFVPSRFEAYEELTLSSGYTQFNLSTNGLSNYPLPGEKFGLYIITSVPVAVIVSDVEYKQSSDTFLALPATLAGTLFMVASYRGYVTNPSYKYSGMEIVAMSTNTTIAIEYPEGIKENVTTDDIDRNSIYRYEDLTGTIITANKPVTVISGTYFAVIPRYGSATMIVEQMFPFHTWTNLYIVPPMPPMTQYIVRILSMENQTICFTNRTDQECLKINRSSNENYFFESDPVLISSEKPVSVAQYGFANSAKSSSSGGFMLLVPGINNYLNTYNFAIPEIREETKHFIIIIVPSSEKEGMILDDESMTFEHEFSVDTSSAKFKVLIKETSAGYHEVKHKDPSVRFGALAYGIDLRHSYGMPLGFTYIRNEHSSTEWSVWSECSVTCNATGVQTRARSCENSQGVIDSCYTDTRLCNMGTCPVDGGFSEWSTWSSCTLTCGEGTQSRTRSCDSPIPQSSGNNCTGSDIQTKLCVLQECQVDGGLSEWSPWSTCTVTCGGGNMSRVRSCDNPAPQHGGQDCTGTFQESTSCHMQECPVDGSYSAWTVWSSCSLTCGSGYRARARVCNNPTPVHGGKNCTGQDTEAQSCNDSECPGIPYGLACVFGSDKCDGDHTECSRAKCRCEANHYHDGDKCISEESINTASDKTTIIVGGVAGVIIIILAVVAITVTVLYRRKVTKELSSNERLRNPVYINMGNSELNVSPTVVVEGNTDGENRAYENQYTSLNSELKDTSSPYDMINVN